MIAATATVVVVVVTLILFLFKKKKKAASATKGRGPPLPPGPTGLPLVGYLPFMWTHNLHQKFAELAATYGPIYKLWLGSRLSVVVSSPLLAREVFRDHDAVFANRNPQIASVLLSYSGASIAFMDYGPLWKKLRKILMTEMLSSANQEACFGLRKQQVRNSVKEIHKISSGGASMDFGHTAFKTTTNSMISMLWDSRGEADDSFFGELRKLEMEMLALMGTPNISDFIPALARFDLQGIEKESKKIVRKFDKILNSAIEARSGGLPSDNRRKDLLQVLLDLKQQGDDETSLDTDQIKALLMDVLVGGSHTTATAIEWAMAEMVQHPGIMTKVYCELDQVVGQNDIVNSSHLPKLTYLEAVIKETFRLHSPLPFLVPHCSSRTTEVGGYTIPKGTDVYVDVAVLHTDPSLWCQPLAFVPERFLHVDAEDNNNNNSSVKFDFQGNNFQYLPFGSGRRVCPGQTLALETEKYVLATLLHSFDWKLPPGVVVEMSDKFEFIIKKSNPLILVPTPRLSDLELYA